MAIPFNPIGAGLGVLGGIIGGGKAARGARRLAGAENAIRRLQIARERALQIREASQSLGIQAVAAGASGIESSAIEGGRASLLNQLQSNLTFISQSDRIGQKAAEAQRLIGRGSKIADFSNQTGQFVSSFQGTRSGG